MRLTRKKFLTLGGMMTMLLVCTALLTALSGASLAAKAEPATSLESIIFTDPAAFQFTAVNATDCSVKLVDKTRTNVRVPVTAKINGTEYNVTEVASNGFSSSAALKTVILPSVIKIGNAAFQNCRNLTLVYAPQVKNIGTSAFALCPALSDIIFPSTLETVGASVFMLSNTRVHARFDAVPDGWTANWNNSNGVQLLNHDFNGLDADGYLWTHDFIYEEVEQASPLSSMTSTSINSAETRLAPLQPLSENINHGHLVIDAAETEIAAATFFGGIFESITILPAATPINIESMAFSMIIVNEGITINRDVTYDTWGSPSEMVFNTVDTPFITLPAPENILPSMFFSCTVRNINFRTATGITYENHGIVKLPAGTGKIGYTAFQKNDNIKHLYIPASITEIGNEAFAEWNSTQKIYVPFYSEAQAVGSWGTGWLADNSAQIIYEETGELSLISQPAEINDTNIYSIIFEYKVNKNKYTLDEFVFSPFFTDFGAGLFTNILDTSYETNDELRGDYWVRRWEYKFWIKSTTSGGCRFTFELRASKDGVHLDTKVTEQIKVSRFIRTAADFTVADFKNSAHNFALLNDINLGSITYPSQTIFVHAANKVKFYGNNYTITYKITVPMMPARTGYNLTLFTENQGSISNLKINATYTVTDYVNEVDQGGTNQSGSVFCAGIAIENAEGALIENCESTISANINCARGDIAGIVNDNYGRIVSCTTKGSMVSAAGVTGIRSGGIANTNGLQSSNAEITGCINKAAISGYSNIGGIVTQNERKVTNCRNEGNLTLNYKQSAGDRSIGGIAGILGYNSRSNASCTYSQNTGIIKFGQADYPSAAMPNMGMIIGRNWQGSGITSNNTVGGSINFGTLPTYNRTYAGYREIGRNS